MPEEKNEQVERVARALCATGPMDPDEIGANDGPNWGRYVEQAKAAIAAAQAWQPIETAPKDGIAFLGYQRMTKDLWVITPMYYNDGVFKMVEFNESNFENEYFPTHWTNIPTPPAAQEGE